MPSSTAQESRNSINLFFSIHTFAGLLDFEPRYVFSYIGFEKKHILSLSL